MDLFVHGKMMQFFTMGPTRGQLFTASLAFTLLLLFCS